MALPNFLIVGSAKSGTTTLYHGLSQHPDVFMPELKEPCYFSDGQPNYVRTDREYEGLFGGRTTEKAIGEASATYLYDPKAPSRIKRLLGSPRIIIILRNPVNMAYSLWGHAVYQQGEEDLSFEEALAAEDSRMASSEFLESRTLPFTNYFYFRRGLYYEQVKRYLDEFGPDNVKVLIFEEYIRDPEPFYRELFGFLGVDPGFRPDMEKKNVATGFRFGLLHRFLVNPPRLLTGIYASLPVKLKYGAYRVLRRIYGMTLTTAPRPPLDERIKAELGRRYLPDIKKLEALLGRDLSVWYAGKSAGG